MNTQKLNLEFLKLFHRYNFYDRHQGLILHFNELLDENDPHYLTPFYSLTIQEKHLSSPNVCHGGVLSGMMDSTLGLSALFAASREEKVCATVEFKINFLQPVFANDTLRANAKMISQGRQLCYLECEIRNSHDTLVAKAASTCKILSER